MPTYPPYSLPPDYTVPPYTIPPSLTLPPGYTVPPIFNTANNGTVMLNFPSNLFGSLAAFIAILTCVSNCLLCHCYLAKHRNKSRRKINHNQHTPFSSATLPPAENEIVSTTARSTKQNRVLLYAHSRSKLPAEPVAEQSLVTAQIQQPVAYKI